MKSNWNLEQACALIASDDCRGQSLLHVIMETLKAPRTASFQQLLSLPKIRDLQNRPETIPYYSLIELFAYGSYSDYTAASEGSYPPLTSEHIRKLKMLTLLTIGAKNRILPYDMLQVALEIPNVSDLEQLVIDCLYDGNLEAKLDQSSQCVRLLRVEGRDVHPAHKAEMISSLESWLESCENFQSRMETLAADVDVYTKSRKEQQKHILEQIDKAKKEFASKHTSRREGASAESLLDHDVEMIDEAFRSGHGFSHHP